MGTQLPPRLAIIGHISEVLLNYISVDEDDHDDVVDANRVAEDIADLTLDSLRMRVLGGPTKDGRILVEMVPNVPDDDEDEE